MAETQETSFKTKMYAYSFPRIFSSLLLGTIGFSVLFLYSLAYGVNTILVGFGQAIGYLSIAAGQFLLGWLSDGKYTRWGRRKPYIFIFAPLEALSFVFLLLPNLLLINPTEMTLFLWLVIWNTIFQFSYGFATVHQSWMPEQFSVDERNKVSQVLNIFGIIGQGTMLIFTFVVLTAAKDKIVADPSVIPPEFLITVIVFAILLLVAYFLGTKLMPTEPFHEIETSYIQQLKIIFNDKNYILMTIMQGIASFGWIIVGQVMLVYIEVVLNFSTLEYLIAALVLMFGIILFLGFWRRLIDKKGKKSSLLIVFLFAMTFLLLTLVGFIQLTPPINFIFGIIFMLGIAAFTGGWYMFPPILNANLAEDESKRSKVLLAGTYKGFPSIPLNIFQAFGSMLLGAILALPSFGTLTYSIGLIIWGPICSVFLLAAYIYTRKLLTFDFEWEKE